jgi:hypothetical protein
MTALGPGMTALGQGMAGLALVMGFALLCVRQIRAATILLSVQSAAAAVTAIVQHQPLMAIPPILLTAAVWFTPDHLATLEPRTTPLGGAKPGIAAAAVLAALCQTQYALALPLSVILLSALLAATRRHPLMHVMALISLQNGIVLTASPAQAILPLACLLLPLTLAGGILIPRFKHHHAAHWHRWVDLGLALAILLATLLTPLDPIASIFAPLLGLDLALRSWHRTGRPALPPIRRGLALLAGLFPLLAVCPSNPAVAWLAILACIATSLLPALTRRWDDAVLATLGAGIALFGLAATGSSVLAYFSIFAGFTAIAAVVPDLAPILVILILRLAIHTPAPFGWPASVQALGLAVAIVALIACAALLRGRSSLTPLQQSQAAIAAIAICLGQPDGRFAALVLLILLILSRSAARITSGPVASLAIAGLAGVPPLGVFPGLILVALAVTSHQAWLLLPIGAAAIPILLAGLPRRLPALIPSIGWLPMALALLTGYFAPDGLVRWWHIVTAGHG